MKYEWKQIEPGIRIREHPTRKHGLKPDIYYVLRFQANGKRQEEALGWASEGITLTKARLVLANLKEAVRLGIGPTSIRETRKKNFEEKCKIEKEMEEENISRITFSKFWYEKYLPYQQTLKNPRSIATEIGLFSNWINPVLGDITFKELQQEHLDKIVGSMTKSHRSPRTIHYALAVVSQVWNMAYNYKIVDGENPVRRVKKPKVNNARMRFLTKEEATALLEIIKPRSESLYGSCLLSLFCGLRAGEIHALLWGDVNFKNGEIFIRDPKNGHNRYAYMTKEIKIFLNKRYTNQPKNKNIFPSSSGNKRQQISKLFEDCVNELNLNDGYSDRRQKVVFHTLRHTFASWHVERGTPLFQLGILLGHRTPQMTQRYSHLSPDSARTTALKLEGILDL